MEETVTRLIPNWLKPTLRAARARIQKLWRDPLIPPASLHLVGSGDFVATGEEFFKYFKDYCALRPYERILDIGCGTGRMAKPLTKYLKGGSYEGMDIVSPSIKWCQEAYTRRYPNFHFHFADIYNKSYYFDGKCRASDYLFPFETASFDFVFLTSVFTHMLPEDMDHYISEISRVLKTGGRCLITYFLLNEDSKKLINEGVSYHKFDHELRGCRVENEASPEDVVAYDESTIRDLYYKYQLKISEPTFYGQWCARKNGVSWQDMIIARKID